MASCKALTVLLIAIVISAELVNGGDVFKIAKKIKKLKKILPLLLLGPKIIIINKQRLESCG